MITVTVIGADRVIAKLKRVYPAMLQRLAITVNACGQDLAGYIKASKLHGQVLQQRTGKLAGSVRAQPVQVGSDSVISRVGSYNCTYAAIHEYGGRTAPHDIVPRNKKALYWAGAAHPVMIVHHPGSNFPERSFLRSALADKAAFYRQKIEQAAGAAMRGA